MKMTGFFVVIPWNEGTLSELSASYVKRILSAE